MASGKQRLSRKGGRGSTRGVRSLFSPKLVRSGLIVASGVFAFAIALQVSLVGVTRNMRPQLALSVVPIDATARAKLASQLVTIEEGKAAARALALDAVRRDPIQPIALRVLAQSFDGDAPEADRSILRLMSQSEKLTRRDVLTQMWFVDHFGHRGDAEGVVAHFDNLLRSSEPARTGAFPMLVLAASSDTKVGKVILEKLATKPNWADEFTQFAVGSGSDLDFANSVARLLLDVNDRDDRQLFGTLQNRFVEAGRYSSAWDLYNSHGLSGPGAAEKPIRNGDFEAASDKSPFEWYFSQAPELWAARDKSANSAGFVLQVAASNGRSGEVARQFLHLSPGAYRLDVRMGNIPATEFGRPELRLDCVDGGSAKRLVLLTPDAAGTGPFSLTYAFVVPQDCTFQRLGIRIAGDDPLQGAVPWVDDIRIR